VYRRGRFDAAAASFTADLLRAYGWALFPVSVTMLLNRICFAAGRFRLPFIVGLACTAAQVCLDYLLVARIGPAGVGWGAAGSSVLQVCLLTAAMTLTAGSGRDVARLLFPIGCWVVIGLVGAKPVTGICTELCGPIPAGGVGTLLRLGLIWGVLQAFAAVVAALARGRENAVRE
nr:polysaccharide biosynthesis C-terminal domain-containing protein [Candidatus Ozemobacteraceae bacterium]